MEQQITRELLTITTSKVSRADKAVGARFNEVAMRALGQAEKYLIRGPEDYRAKVTVGMLNAISRLSAADADEAITAMRAQLLSTFGSLANDGIQPQLTHADTEAITTGTHDQDLEE